MPSTAAVADHRDCDRVRAAFSVTAVGVVILIGQSCEMTVGAVPRMAAFRYSTVTVAVAVASTCKEVDR